MVERVRGIIHYWGVLLWLAAVLAVLSGCARNEMVSAAPLATTPAATATVQLLETTYTATPIFAATATSTAAIASPTPLPTPTTSPEEPISLADLLPTATPANVTPALPTYAPTPDGVVRRLKIPILMYHYVSTPPADADIYRRDLSAPPELFAAHLDRLLAEGYTTISLYQMINALQQGAPLPEKPVVITFDDGYRDNYENAFPLLKERAMQATIFVVTDFMDEERPAYLTWEMAREMAQAGISIESHGRNHVSLASKDDDYLVWQALGSLETIEYELGIRPRFVSYPAGEYDERTIDIFHSAHYWAGLTTQQGATLNNQQTFELPRVRVRNTTTPDELIRLLSLDW